MSDTAVLLLILAGLHAMESCVVVPHGALVLWRDLLGRPVAARATGLMRVARGRFVFLNLLQPRAHLLVAGLPHLLPTAAGVLDIAPEEDDARRRRPFRRWEEIGAVRVAETAIVCPGLGAVECGSSRAARLWARALETIRAAPPARRARLAERWLRLRLAPEISRRRAARVAAACRTLERVGTTCFILLLAAAAVAVQRQAVIITTALLGVGILSGAAIAVAYWRAHARLAPRAVFDRLGRAALMLVCFPVAFRARATLGRDAIAHAHAAAAAALLPQRRARALLAGMIRRWTHPAAPPPAGSPDARELATAAAAMLTHLDAIARACDIDPASLRTAPALADPSIQAWCPRCHATYTHPAGTCADCSGVPLITREAR